jgi:hypothetical protein
MARAALDVLTPTRIKGCCVALAPPLPALQADDLAAVFRALADPTRVQMLHMLKAASGRQLQAGRVELLPAPRRPARRAHAGNVGFTG